MLWIIIGRSSHQIISCNTAEVRDQYQVWVERPNGKTLKVHESKSKEEMEEVKNAIDFAIKNDFKTLELSM